MSRNVFLQHFTYHHETEDFTTVFVEVSERGITLFYDHF